MSGRPEEEDAATGRQRSVDFEGAVWPAMVEAVQHIFTATLAGMEQKGQGFAVFQSTSNGSRQFLSNRRSNRHIVPLYGNSHRPFTQGCTFAHR